MAEETETASGAGAAEGSLLERIMVEGKLARDQSQREYARDLVGEFVNAVLAGATVSNDVVNLINDKIAEIDDLLSTQVNEILHHEEFQKLEGSWRGLHYLVFNTETGTQLKLRLLNITKAELLKDLEKAVEFDQSALFKKVYEEEYGTFGGFPYSCLIGDFEFGRHPRISRCWKRFRTSPPPRMRRSSPRPARACSISMPLPNWACRAICRRFSRAPS